MIFVLTTAWLCLISGNKLGVFGMERKIQSLGLNPEGSVGIRGSMQAFAVAVVGGCPPLKSKTVKIICTHKISKDIDCTKKVPAGTKATFTCPNNTYILDKYDSVTCGVPTKKKWSGKIVKCRSTDFTSTTISTSSVETTASMDTTVSDLSSSGEETTISLDTTIGGDITNLSTDLTPSTNSSVESSTITTAVTSSNATTVANTNASNIINTSTTTENTLITNATTVLATTILTPTFLTATTAPTTTTIHLDSNISTTTTAIDISTSTTAASSTTTTTTTTSEAPFKPTPIATTTATTSVAPLTTSTATATTTSSATTLTTPTTTTVALPPGYEKVPGVGVIKTSKVPKIYYDAKAECQLEGATLFVINNTNKNDYMVSFAAKPEPFVGATLPGYVWSGVEFRNNVWKTPQGVDIKTIPSFKWGVGRPYSIGTVCSAYVKSWFAHLDQRESCLKTADRKQPYICEM